MPAFNKETASEAGKRSCRKGKPNKATRELRETVKAILESYAETMEEDLKALEPKDRLNILVRLLEFAIPKLTRGEMTGPDGGPMQTIIEFIDASNDNNVLFLPPETHTPPVTVESAPDRPIPPLPPVRQPEATSEPGKASDSVMWL